MRNAARHTAMLLPLVVASWATAGLAAPGVSGRAARIHERLITLDSHLDTPASLDRPGWVIEEAHDDYTQVDLPKMKKGGLDGGFWAIYTPQGPLDPEHIKSARDFAIMRGVSIRMMVAADPVNFALATTAEDAALIAAQHKRIVYMSIENAYPLGGDETLLSAFYAMGVRLMGFAHFANNQFADSSTDPKGPKWGGLSPAGKALLAEANRLGVVPDASHSSDAVLDDLLKLSKTPVLLSHSGCKAIYDNPRNIDDAHLKALAAKGGVIQMNAYGGYLRAIKPNPERDKAMRAMFASIRSETVKMTKEQLDAITAERRRIDKLYPETDKPSFDDFLAHILHALKVVGPEHVGIGLDWDGGGGVTGMEDVRSIPKITDALLKAGYSEADLANIWSGNVLRLLKAAQEARAK